MQMFSLFSPALTSAVSSWGVFLSNSWHPQSTSDHRAVALAEFALLTQGATRLRQNPSLLLHSTYLSTHPSITLFKIHPSICPSTHPHPPTYQSIYMITHPSTCPSSNHLSFIHPPINSFIPCSSLLQSLSTQTLTHPPCEPSAINLSPICLFIHQSSIQPSSHLYIPPYTLLSIHPFIHPLFKIHSSISIYRHIHPPTHPLIHSSIIHLSIHPCSHHPSISHSSFH